MSGKAIARLWPGPELARELELAEAAVCREFAVAAARLYPQLPIRVVEHAGGVAISYGAGDPLNGVKGAGLCGSVDADEWDEVEEAFLPGGSPVVVDLCPFADAEFVNVLGARGYRIGAFETVLCKDLALAEEPAGELPAGLSICAAKSPEQFTRVVGIGFAHGGEPMKFAVDFGRVRARMSHAPMLIASIDGEEAGGAAVSFAGRVAHMSGAAVLPRFRGRGIQRALTEARLRLARERGCVLAKLDVEAGSVSHRNAERAGFRVAYTRPQMVRAPGVTG